ncbi:WYL domain-containing protein [Flavobacterium sp.]|jgi:predicted DNA-binding transcriptional regulator YafY|uniref:WYL domain-containing protein n=1 Tax=Flavobacterium sp. TaxID=239 RepID=UPI0037BFAB19
MNQLQRLEQIYTHLKKKEHCYQGLYTIFQKMKVDISIRQIQRDVKNVYLLLKDDERLINYRDSFRVIYFEIVKTKEEKIHESVSNIIFQKTTNFFELIENKDLQNNLSIIKQALSKSKKIGIAKLKNDVTGDNFNFNQKNIEFLPLQVIKHRGSIYLGGYNEKQNKYQIFDITQIKNITITENIQGLNVAKIEEGFYFELEKRFGVTKNINEEVYSIVIEFTEITGNFIKQHFWHKTQKFKKKGNIIQMEFQCGINRELIGWLFYWMYNCRVVKPQILKDYYDSAANEIIKTSNPNNPLVYKNLFVPIKSND